MGIPRLIFPILFAIGLSLVIAGSVVSSKNGFSNKDCKPEDTSCTKKKLTGGAIMLIVGSTIVVCAGIGIGFEYKSTGKVASLFSLESSDLLYNF